MSNMMSMWSDSSCVFSILKSLINLIQSAVVITYFTKDKDKDRIKLYFTLVLKTINISFKLSVTNGNKKQNKKNNNI